MAKSKRQQRIRNMYSKMASGIRRRAKRLQKEYGPWLKSANDALSMAKPLRELGTDVSTKDLKRAMKQLQRLRPAMYKKDIEKNLQATIEQLHNPKTPGSSRYESINRGNIMEFLGMMEDIYYKSLAKIYGSPEVAQQINQIAGSRKPMTNEQLLLNMQAWSEYIDEKKERAEKRGKTYMPPKLNIRRKPGKKSGSKKLLWMIISPLIS